MGKNKERLGHTYPCASSLLIRCQVHFASSITFANCLCGYHTPERRLADNSLAAPFPYFLAHHNRASLGSRFFLPCISEQNANSGVGVDEFP